MTSNRANRQQHRIALIGPLSVGRRALLNQFCNGYYTDSYEPCYEDAYRKMVTLEDRTSIVEVLDARWNQRQSALFEVTINDAEGIFIPYSITSQKSFVEVRTVWNAALEAKSEMDKKKLEHKMKGPSRDSTLEKGEWKKLRGRIRRVPPLVIVGNKLDLEQEERAVSREDGENLAKELGAVAFFEVSAKNATNVEEAFHTLIREIQRIKDDDKQKTEENERKAKEEEEKRNGCWRGRKCVVM